MSDFSLINLGELSKPATVLIEKVSEAVGGIARPHQIKRIAKAEAAAALIKAEADIKISEIQYRALNRIVYEEGRRQENIENITEKAISDLSPDSKPEKIEKDWLTFFFDMCRLTADEEMQSVWARVLAGEANLPGSFSKRSIQLLASLDKRDAELFTKLCTFSWTIGELTPVILDDKNPIYTAHGINFSTLTHLDNLGLIDFAAFAGFKRTGLPKNIRFNYYEKSIAIEFPSSENNFEIGKVLLTQVGKELAPICGSKKSDKFYSYLLEEWSKNENIRVSE